MKRIRLLPVAASTLLIVALPLLFFWRLIFTNLILVGVDSFLYFYPYKAYVAQALRAGHIPLWNPHLFMGAPLLANMQTAILYPLHWPLLWLSAPKQVAASIVLHVILAGLGTLAYTRRSLKLSWPGALTAAITFALGGFVGAQTEHVNQLNVIAWLPWTFLLLDVSTESRRRGAPMLGLGLVIALMILAGHAQATYICLVGLGIYGVAGGCPSRLRRADRGPSWLRHAGRGPSWLRHAGRGRQEPNFKFQISSLKARLPHLLVFATAIAVAILLAAVQILPALELSRLSVRSGGLPYREAVSFSLRPWLLHFTLLPPFGVDLSQIFGEAYSEYVAYVGVIGLGLALFGLLRGWRQRPGTRFFALLAAGGLFLGLGGFNPAYFVLYKLVPGFDLFRAPARWMLFYAFGAAILAGIGMEQIANLKISKLASQRIPRFQFPIPKGHAVSNLPWPTRQPALPALARPGSRQPWSRPGPTCACAPGAGRTGRAGGPQAQVARASGPGGRQYPKGTLSPILLALVCIELFLASQGLHYNQPTAPEAFTFLRPSIAHLKTDPGLGRFLSLSGIVYDPGDLAEMHTIFAGQLPDKAIYDYVVAAKEKEVLFYNLPLLYGLYSVDGYDGGLLPLRDFVTMERLFLDDEHLSLDGRLRENLREVPPGRLLSLLGVKYVITDKVFDVWIDGVFYDLQFSARLSPGGAPSVGTTDLPDFPTTALGVISHLEGAGDLPDGTPVAHITVADGSGWSETFEMLAGRDTSQGRYGDDVAHRQARVGHTWRDDPAGSDYITLIPLDGPRRLTAISVSGMAPAGEFVLRGLSLVDMRTTTSRQVTLSTEGHYRLVHSGDVKIYENLDVLPRAFVVHQAEVVAGDDQAIAHLRDPAFDPAQTAILASGEPLVSEGKAEVARPGPPEIVSYTPEEVIVDVTTDVPGYLLLTDTFYPGWQATVGGKPAEILRADVLFRAVQLEPGMHRVEFRYRPASVRWGAGISAITLLLGLGGFIWSLQKKDLRGL